MAVTDVAGRKSGSFTSINIDSFNGLASSLRVSTIADDAVIIDSEPERNGEFKRFVKLKKSHWVAPKQQRNCKLCLSDFGSKSKKLNCRRFGPFIFRYNLLRLVTVTNKIN